MKFVCVCVNYLALEMSHCQMETIFICISEICFKQLCVIDNAWPEISTVGHLHPAKYVCSNMFLLELFFLNDKFCQQKKS